DLSALLARLGARSPASPAARDLVKRSLERLLASEKLRETFERKEQKWPTIARELAARGLPEELGYMAWAESGFRSEAKRPLGSPGVWQFLPETARRFGLTVTDHLDERTDLAKETRAATEYLAHLSGEFGKDATLLAMAAYNAGERRIHSILDEQAKAS